MIIVVNFPAKTQSAYTYIVWLQIWRAKSFETLRFLENYVKLYIRQEKPHSLVKQLSCMSPGFPYLKSILFGLVLIVTVTLPCIHLCIHLLRQITFWDRHTAWKWPCLWHLWQIMFQAGKGWHTPCPLPHCVHIAVLSFLAFNHHIL